MVGNVFTYAALDDQQAVVSHQLSLGELNTIYHIRERNTDTTLFALIGDPIDRSIGHRFHNHYFQQHGINALYVKLALKIDELTAFFSLSQHLPFKGFSVTMPLKQAVLPFVVSQSNLAAVNTLKVKAHTIEAINTDGDGALAAIEHRLKVKDQRLLVMGAGGAAMAIVQAAHQRGAHITIANRTRANAEKLASICRVDILDFAHASKIPFAIVINTIPNVALDQAELKNALCTMLAFKPVVMDVNYNQAKKHAAATVSTISIYLHCW